MKKKLKGVNNIIGKNYFKKNKSGEHFFFHRSEERLFGKLPRARKYASGYEFISISHRLLVRYRIVFKEYEIKMEFHKK
jgi:hypothetical protein